MRLVLVVDVQLRRCRRTSPWRSIRSRSARGPRRGAHSGGRRSPGWSRTTDSSRACLRRAAGRRPFSLRTIRPSTSSASFRFGLIRMYLQPAPVGFGRELVVLGRELRTLGSPLATSSFLAFQKLLQYLVADGFGSALRHDLVAERPSVELGPGLHPAFLIELLAGGVHLRSARYWLSAGVFATAIVLSSAPPAPHRQIGVRSSPSPRPEV